MSLKHFCYIIIVTLCLEKSNSKTLTENALTQKYLERLEQSGYNPHVMPDSTEGVGNPVHISCRLFDLSIFKVDDENMEFQTQFNFGQNWTDPRLAYPDINISMVVLNDPKYIWTPDLYFDHEKEGFLHQHLKPNVFIGIEVDGEVWFMQRLTMFFNCRMDFSKYPHDTQKCLITVESYGYYGNYLDISWLEPICTNNICDLPFEIINIEENTTYHYTDTGNFTTLEVEFTFQRRIDFFITRLYVPFIILTILSWLSFWIPTNLVVYRLSLLMVIFYLMVHIGHNINTQAPKTWYTKGSDVWIAVCQSLVFASFLEFIAVRMVKQNSQGKLCKNCLEAGSVLDPGTEMNISENKELSINAFNRIYSRLKMVHLQEDSIDKISRVTFPVLFTCFNVIYWILFCTGDSNLQ